MEKITTDRLRRNLAETIRRVIAGERFEVELYGKPLGVVLAPLDQLKTEKSAQAR